MDDPTPLPIEGQQEWPGVKRGSPVPPYEWQDFTELREMPAAFDYNSLRPGDRVLVRTSEPVSNEQLTFMRDLLVERFPGVDFTIIQADEILVMHADP